MVKVNLYPGIVYDLPQEPVRGKVFFSRKGTKDQKWSRVPVPDVTLSDGSKINLIDLDYETVDAMYKSGHEVVREFIEEDDKRCTNGLWFMNNGDPTYITGDHYEYLQWFKLDVGYPFYTDKDKKWYYVIDLCDKDQECMGSLYGKKRRDGFSYRAASKILKEARKTFNSTYGMMSKTGDDGQKLFRKVVYAFRHYPEFYKPQVQSAEEVKKELVFSEPIKRVTQKTRRISRGVSLNTTINYRNTGESSYDGDKLRYLIGDEMGKVEETNFEKWLAVVTTCLTQGRKIIGKGIFGSSVEEIKEKSATKKKESGGESFKKVWDKSDPTEKHNGRTLSGLYRYFTPAYEGFEGFIDEYGNSVVETPKVPVMGIDGVMIKDGAKQYLLDRRTAKKEAGDLVGYYEERRQFPFDEDDMFLDPSNESNVLPVAQIHQQIEYNDSFEPLPLRRGNFVWKDGIRDGMVMFLDDPKGRWLVYWFPKEDQRNKWTTIRGSRAPTNKGFGHFSLDPYDHKTTSDSRASDAASHGYREPDIMDPDNSGIFISEYLARPGDPYDMYEDILMQCFFYGWPVLGESNKPGCMNYFEARGYKNYLMERPAMTHTEFSKDNQETPWLPNAGDAVRNSLVTYLQAWIYSNVGLNAQTKKMGKFFFTRTLKDWLKFKSDHKWTDYDLTVSSMYAVIGAAKHKPQKRAAVKMDFFPKYKYNGTEATRLDSDAPKGPQYGGMITDM